MTLNIPFPRRAICSTLLLAALALPMGAQAHKSWLLPNSTIVSGRESVAVIDAVISEDLFEFERSLMLDQLTVTGPDGAAVATENPSSARHRNSFEVKLASPGTYRITNTGESMTVSYMVGAELKRWRGKPEAFAKEVPAGAEIVSVSQSLDRQETFVAKEEPGRAVPAAATTVGLSLQPLGAITDLSTGDTSRFVLLMNGKPFPEATVTVLRAGNRYRYKLAEITLTTDAKGEFSVTWPEAGRYWVAASHGNARPPEGASAAERGTRDKPLRRASYNATFEVLPK